MGANRFTEIHPQNKLYQNFRLLTTKKTESIDSVFFVGISGVEFNSSLEHLCSRIGVAFLTEQRLPLASNLVGKNSS